MPYVRRLVDDRLTRDLGAFPAVLLLGPRAVGKTTTARRIADTVVQLDDPVQAAQFRADPSTALEAMRRHSTGPLLLDEWQAVPEVLGAVKRAVDSGAGNGSFLLTGSVRARLMSASWPGTGRLVSVEMHPMTVLEQAGRAATGASVIDRLLAADLDNFDLPRALPSLADYVDLATVGGYPPVVDRLDEIRRVWLESYVEQLVTRDASELADVRDPTALRRLLRALCETTATLTADTSVASAAGMDVKTVRRQERLLEDLRIVTALPAWHTNRISRLVKQRKRYVVDTGLASAVLGVGTHGVLTNGDILGRLLETFVVAQLRPLLDLAVPRVDAYHLRQHDGRREIDIVLEAADGRLVGIEVKATAAPSPADARHLAWLRDQFPDRFVAGMVLHTGPAAFALDRGIVALPIAGLWS